MPLGAPGSPSCRRANPAAPSPRRVNAGTQGAYASSASAASFRAGVSTANRAYHPAAMTSQRTAIVLGGSGSVGTALLRELFHDDGFHAVITLSRRTLPEAVAM